MCFGTIHALTKGIGLGFSEPSVFAIEENLGIVSVDYHLFTIKHILALKNPIPRQFLAVFI